MTFIQQKYLCLHLINRLRLFQKVNVLARESRKMAESQSAHKRFESGMFRHKRRAYDFYNPEQVLSNNERGGDELAANCDKYAKCRLAPRTAI